MISHNKKGQLIGEGTNKEILLLSTVRDLGNPNLKQDDFLEVYEAEFSDGHFELVLDINTIFWMNSVLEEDNCMNIFLTPLQVEELRDSLTNWLEKHPI